MFYFTLALMALNTMDGIFTWLGLKAGVITELNPLMQDLFLWHWQSFLICKLLIVNLAIFALYRYGHKYAVTRFGMMLTGVVYIGVLLSHARVLYFFMS